jgi:hypothetical protein
MKIERPDWDSFHGSDTLNDTYVSELQFWFDKNVEPINKMLEEGIEVEGQRVRRTDGGEEFWKFLSGKPLYETHKALLINIQPIECEHEPVSSDWTVVDDQFVGPCKHCGKKLKAKWEVDER